MNRITNMLRLRADLGRGAVIIASLAAVFVVALTAPIPTLPDAGRAQVRAEVADRLPGWSVQRIDPTWENAYAVVTSCAGRSIDFQFVPGHGLPRDDAWIQPHSSYARSRLARDLGPPPLPPLARPSPAPGEHGVRREPRARRLERRIGSGPRLTTR